MLFFTPDAYDYDSFSYRLQSQTAVTFAVAACNDAHVALFDSRGTTDAYEVVIGGSSNMWTVIRRIRLVVSERQHY